ncbi:hypothetical protein JOY44_16200 [Phormidium sp. CLA17]|uniref:hypothetical protein n=1 Tax=Leptolyngbya sp. Cla-17 TaxID=2803751 RepID=UPI001491799B|nr:hypothetical protein [Leptolyngbya sp. Cla-17]MBM0743131.1 hypothetical protein [Leptolyngbya sp. Cla-17]
MNVLQCLIASTAIAMAAATLPALADTCYMVTSSGQKIELKGMCGNSSAKSTPVQVRSQPATNATRQTAFSSESLVQEGQGGESSRNGFTQDYHYQVWTNSMNTRYTLKVWRLEDYPNGSLVASLSFQSAGAALDYFDCHYGGKPSLCSRGR